MNRYEWDYCHIHQALAEQLLWCLIEEQQNAVITYKELCDRVRKCDCSPSICSVLR